MKHEKKQNRNMRVANFSNIDLPYENQLSFGSENIETIVKTIRRYADLPFIFVVGREQARKITELLSALKDIRSPCYPYAMFCLEGAKVDFEGEDMDIVSINGADEEKVVEYVDDYASSRFQLNEKLLQIGSDDSLPANVDVAIVGAGVTGLYAANRLMKEGLSFCVLEKRSMVGGIWSSYANSTSRVNSSECAYRLFEKKTRSNLDHSSTREILSDIASLANQVSDHLFLQTEVAAIEKKEDGYRIRLNRGGKNDTLECKGIVLAINDRVGKPREIQWKNRSAFRGEIVSGISQNTRSIEWSNKNAVIVGMGAFAVENARTALEEGARHVTVVCRRHGTVCPKIIDYLNFATPYDEAFRHDRKSNMRNMMYWKKLYDLSGAVQPECWMGKVKHEGHTISVSDIWFIGHYLKKIQTITGQITGMSETGVIVDGQHHIDADLVVNCVGFERNTSVAKELSGYDEMYSSNYIDKNFMYLADAYIDDDAFNSLFGSSVLEMVKFYMEVFILFFNNPDHQAVTSIDGIEKIPIEGRKWSHYIKAAMTLIRNYPPVHEIAKSQVARRTDNFLQIHDLKHYIEANKREWIDTHALLAGKPMKEEECLPYVFEKLLSKQDGH